MADKAQKKPEAKPVEKNVEKPKDEVVKSQSSAPKRERVVWTLDRCKKYARRYSSEILWASGAPASYKSAVAHGWLADCVREIENLQHHGGGKVIAGAFGKKTNPTVPISVNQKKAA